MKGLTILVKTLKLSDETHKELSKLGTLDETYEDVLKRLIVFWKTNQVCPQCKKGRMLPSGKVGHLGNIEKPFSEIADARRYKCDNCGHVQFNAENTENVNISERVSASVGKANHIKKPQKAEG